MGRKFLNPNNGGASLVRKESVGGFDYGSLMGRPDLSLMFWNYQRTGHPQFHKIVAEYRKEFYPNILYLFETWISGSRADGIIGRLGFSNSFEANVFARASPSYMDPKW
ncbi:hypothetical protein PVK06_008024 [Gossypium arboreum]|uniref:Uncharacterized protein n=1 Tax=Gossypium arboreum TaxID=29729 RepID=A0ABR0QJ38_GOSAR|nr:hypothetical protein PVK06_008024 [Gossypium arboreum]